jgi:hypothetical protein
MLARSLWFSFNFARSIICFISSALGWFEVVVVVAVVFDVEAGLVAVELVGGGVGLCANEIETAPRRTQDDLRSVVRLFIGRVWQRMAHRVKL